MAENLFEKYGIKEVADVTLFRIERKNETYESQRKIQISSILKSALTKEMVYPLDEDGKGSTDGYEAYVFKDADILTHFNYDCDDLIETTGVVMFTDNGNPTVVNDADLGDTAVGERIPNEAGYDIQGYITGNDGDPSEPNLFFADNIKILSLTDEKTGADLTDKYETYFTNNYPVTGITAWDKTDYKIYYKGIYPNGIFTGSIVNSVAMEISNIPTNGTITITFNNTELVSVTNIDLASVLTSLNDGSSVKLTVSQLAALVAAAEDNETITVDYSPAGTADAFMADITSDNPTETISDSTLNAYNNFMVYFKAKFVTPENSTGHYDGTVPPEAGHYTMDPDKEYGTHEFTYPQQICMLYAKNQNLITKVGTRYSFSDPDSLFGSFEFSDNFSSTPNGTKKIVVVGLQGKISENKYDLDEINTSFSEITDFIEAKAYDIYYSDYAELVVEDEMGYYLPQQLGYSYNKKENSVVFFDNSTTYGNWSKLRKGTDTGIFNAIETWGNDTHYSINDAIDALKQEQKLLDTGASQTTTPYTRVFGGYKVVGEGNLNIQSPIDDTANGLKYSEYRLNEVVLRNVVDGTQLTSTFELDSVLNALATANFSGETGQVRIMPSDTQKSNRAIYIDMENTTLANGAYIYLLKNVNSKALVADTNGIFEFYDKNGNKLYYQDKIFAGIETLALVVIGKMGLVFIVNRCGTKSIKKTAWMINEGGYISDKQCEKIAKNGLIHTVSITEDDETFDATCSVESIKVRKIKKNVLHYIPVLFLDTLKISTLEEASSSTDATGGKGNAKLITWDYGKEITLTIQDALYTPASMSAIWGGTKGDLKKGIKDTHMIDRMEKIIAKRSFIIPAGNQEGTPTEGNITAQAVYYDPNTMEPFQDGTPIAEGEVIYKFTRSVAYDDNSIGNTIEISADGFPGTYRVVGETFVRDKKTGEDQRFQFIIPEAKMSAETTSITLQADGDPVVKTNATVKVA